MVQLTPGLRLFSAVDATEVLVLRAPEPGTVITCGGRPMTAEKPAELQELPSGDGTGTQVGRRYTDEATGVEIICTTPGEAVLAVGGAPLSPKDPKALPSSD